MPIKSTTLVNEGSSPQVQFILTDFDGSTGVPNTDVSTATFTLKDLRTGAVINSRSAIDVTNGNNGATHDANGNFSITLASADTEILSNSKSIEEEKHIALFIFTKTDGSVLKEEIWLTIQNLGTV